MRSNGPTEETCRNCDRMLGDDATRCACGLLTSRASFAERNEDEVRRWRAYKSRVEGS